MQIELEILGNGIILIAIYAPNNDANTETKNVFEKDLTSLLDNIFFLWNVGFKDHEWILRSQIHLATTYTQNKFHHWLYYSKRAI